jgi:hypothetical protein
MSARRFVSRLILTVGVVLVSVLAGALVLAGTASALNTHALSLTFGGSGQLAGQLSSPAGVAVNSITHNVYVADPGNFRVDEFSSSGSFLRAWGWGVSDGLASFESCTLSCQAGISGSGAGQFTTPTFIAVDNTAGPSAGDVYVGDTGNSLVTKFESEGNLVGGWGTGGQLNGSTATDGPFGSIDGVAVDTSGGLMVINGSKRVFEFAQDATFTTDFEVERGTAPNGLAVDAKGNFYKANGNLSVEGFTAAGSDIGQVTLSESATGLAVDSATNDLYAGEGNRIEHYVFPSAGKVNEPGGTVCTYSYGSGCAPTDTFGAKNLSGGKGIAADSASGNVFVSTAAGQVEVFSPVVLPDVSAEAATGLTAEAATAHGTVNPAGVLVTSCQFEYGTEAGVLSSTAPCSPAPGSGSSPVAVSAGLAGLEPGTTYHYKLTATNANGSSESDEATVTTVGPKVVSESFSNVGSSTATVNAQIEAGGELTSFIVEYGPTAAYGWSTASVSIGSSTSTVGVVAYLSGLQPGSAYHFRFVATNEAASAQGADMTLTTLTQGTLGLPDERGYEMVSSPESEGAQVYAPNGSSPAGLEIIGTSYPFRAAADGHAVAYVGEPNAEGNGNEIRNGGNEFMASRSATGGWTRRDIQPSGLVSPRYTSFSDDLATSILFSTEPLSTGIPVRYEYLYARENGNSTLRPFFTVTPPNRTTYYKFGAADSKGNLGEYSLGRFYAGASRDSKHLFFEANDALTPNAVDGGESANNLYESTEGNLRLVNVLPNGSTHANAWLGAPPATTEEAENSGHAISADGSRVFWTDMTTGSLYVREDGISTVLIAEHATFLTASDDGTRVLYTTEGDLYEENLSSKVTTDLAPAGQVLGLAGASQDIEYVYFVAEAVLAVGATAGKPNLYLHHAGTTAYIATLGSEGEEALGFFYDAGSYDDWRPELGHRTAEASANGQALVFMSNRSLTGYDNRNQEGRPAHEVYVYETSSGSISCISCSPSGERPTSVNGGPSGYLAMSDTSTYQLRSISEGGGRVVFQSGIPLVAQDTNGTIDVYEWEEDGAGGCHTSGGCVFLLSNGSGSGASYFVDASADGSDVFMVTRAQLVGEDQNEVYDLYDARIGVKRPPSPPQCTGAGCQGVPEAPPIFATPSSVTFSGIGNFPPPAKAVTPRSKSKAKGKHKHKKSKKARKSNHSRERQGRGAKKAAMKTVATGKSGRSK